VPGHEPILKLRAAVLSAAFAGAAAVLALIALAVLIVALPAPARADWIVTRQGERFEIQGTWQQKGKLVVFTLPNGNLSSIRADRVDFDASKRATEEAKKLAEAPPPPPPAKAKRKAVIVLTDKDFRKGSQPGEAGGSVEAKAATAPAPGSGSGGKGNSPSKEVPSSVEVVSWERVPASDSKANGAEINGTVRNVSQDLLTDVTVVAQLFDDNGGLIGRFTAVVENQQLPPTESSKFHLVATGVYAFGSLRWETQGKGIRSMQPATQPPSGP
jgi:hypothetical protein